MKFSIVAVFAAAVLLGTFTMTSSTAASTTTGAMLFVQDDCVVIGNNDVPLRVRSTPGGRVIGSLNVGSNIKAWDIQTKNGVDWTKISWKRGYGWVATEFVSCG
ncbi:MAG: hypothetical protein WBC19_07550 [Pyrinomonadaceae bacterium]|nr:hypothetical protein [Chloracidobacterium sp.]